MNSLMGSVQGWGEGQLPNGVTFAQGYHLEAVAGGGSAQYTADELEGCLYNTGAFAEIRITNPAGTWNPYWQIDGRTAATFGQAQDLQELIRGTIQTCVTSVTIKDEFPLQIVTIPRADGQGNVYDQSTGGGVPAAPDAAQRCQPGQIYRGWYYGCQPATCPPGQVYQEGLFSAGCAPIGQKGLLDSLGLGGSNSTLWIIGAIGLVAFVAFRPSR